MEAAGITFALFYRWCLGERQGPKELRMLSENRKDNVVSCLSFSDGAMYIFHTLGPGLVT